MLIPLFIGLFSILIPAVLLIGEKKWKAIQWLSPVFFCYVLGIISGVFILQSLGEPDYIQAQEVVKTILEITVPLAIPLLLFSTDMKKWLSLAKGMLISFGLAILSVMLVSIGSMYVLQDHFEEPWSMAGMAIGVYTGGTANMAAIGTALDMDHALFLEMNLTDLLMSSLYFLGLMTVIPGILAFWFPRFNSANEAGEIEKAQTSPFSNQTFTQKILWIVQGLGLSIIILGIAVGVSILIRGKIDEAIVIIGITVLGLVASLLKPIREMPGTYETGEFLLLMFCFAIGLMIDPGELLNTPPALFMFMAIVVYGSVILHYLLARICGIDRDTVIITSTAGIFGPPFVGPIARVLNNRAIVASGMIAGVIGLALGNFLGIVVARMLGG